MDTPTDRYLTPAWILAIARETMGGIDQDPYHDPAGSIGATHVADIRAGDDGHTLPRRPRSFANPPYSGRNPELAAMAFGASVVCGVAEQMLLVPAATASRYWERWIWPVDPLVALLGRVSFIAGVDMPIMRNGIIGGWHRAGREIRGNRHDIALVYPGVHRSAFARACRRVGKPIVRLGHVPTETIAANAVEAAQ